MQFAFPLFLIALASILIPLIIHLFYFQRYRTEYFSNVRFLKEVVEEKQTRSRLRNILVLLSRIFFIVFLVLAFAQPFLRTNTGAENERPDFVSLFIDNSYSMESLSSETPVFQVAVNRAREIIRSYPEGTSFQILTNQLNPSARRVVDQDLAIGMIDEIEMSSEITNLSHIYEFVRKTAESQEAKAHMFWLSDFQRNSIPDPIEIDSTLTLFPVPVQPVEVRNISIDSSWFESPVPEANQENQMFVRLTNYGSAPAESRIVWRENDEVRPVSTVSINPGESVIDTIGVQLSGEQSRSLILEVTDHPITFDNRYYLQLNGKRKLRILIIDNGGSPNRYLQSAFQQQATVEKKFVPIDRIVYSEFDQQDLIVLDDLTSINSGLASNLSRYLEQGGNILIFPGPDGPAVGVNEFLREAGQVAIGDWMEEDMEALGLNFEDFVFSDVFEKQQSQLALPSVRGYYALTSGNRAASTHLMRLRNGNPLISKIFAGNGLLYLSLSPLDSRWNTLGNHADIFIPMLYRMALSRAKTNQLAYFIGKDQDIQIKTDEELQSEAIVISNGEYEFIPSYQQTGDIIQIYLHDQIRESGFYQVLEDDKSIAHFAMNNSRGESDISLWNPQDLKTQLTGHTVFMNNEQLASLGQFIQEFDRGKVFWKYCLIFALVFLILESLLLRFFKN